MPHLPRTDREHFMHARMAEPLSSQDDNLTHRIRDVAADVGLLMVAATFILLGGAGLVSHLLGVAYPLSGLMVADGCAEPPAGGTARPERPAATGARGPSQPLPADHQHHAAPDRAPPAWPYGK